MNKYLVYASHNVEYKAGKIYHPVFGWIAPLLVNGNSKLGAGVWTWSTLAGTVEYKLPIQRDIELTVKGTCACDCKGCYAKTGFYNMPSVLRSNAIKTWIARNDLDFMVNAIISQIQADNIEFLRIHASGDFYSMEYAGAWHRIATECKTTVFWSYTKNKQAEQAFNDLDNVNIVKSCIPGVGFNFGHCDYIMDAYNQLKSAGKSVYICRCGVDPNQHCNNCKGCSRNEYVLFIEHSTNYKAVDDPHFQALADVIEHQARQ